MFKYIMKNDKIELAIEKRSRLLIQITGQECNITPAVELVCEINAFMIDIESHTVCPAIMDGT